MPEKREKTLSYRRAEWIIVTDLTLEKCLRDAYKARKNIGDRALFVGEQCVKTVKTRDVQAGGLLVHITSETPGEAASVVPKADPKTTELDLKSERPVAEGEWLNGDAFLFVKGDHVCMCSTELRDGAIHQYLFELFKKSKLPEDTVKFELLKVADMSKIKMLHKQGVKELEIRATMYKASADYEKRKGNATGLPGFVAKQVRALIGKPNDVTPDGLRVFLSIRTDRRFGQKALALGESRIEALAADVVKNQPKDGDKDKKYYDYVIKTGTGQRITPDEVFMKSTVAIDADGKTVRCDKVWKELTKFFDDLEESGALEQ
jgi:hypothetical protein